jgi:hypothetical protein
MSNRTATRSGFARLARILTIAVVQSKTSRSALLGWLVLSASGCENTSIPAPTPQPPPVTVLTVRLEGRVLDEHNQPVGGAWIGGPRSSTTADEKGSFSLTVDWPSNWRAVGLGVSREGYESNRVSVAADEATRPVLINLYRSLTISPGETIPTSVSLRSYTDCGWEPYCRRVIVNSSSDKFVDIEVIPADSQDYAGLAVGDELQSGYNFPRRVTASGGDEVWIVVRQLGQVTIVATNPDAFPLKR